MNAKYSKEPPTEPGWYWATYAGRVTVVEIVSEDGIVKMANADYDGASVPLAALVEYYSHWLGPLPEPTMPK